MSAILLLAHGGPSSLDDIRPFLEQVRGGRPCSDEMLDAVREKYRCIGGSSPMPDITRRTAARLQETCGLPVYVGMLHWHPFAQDTIPRMEEDGVSKALVICLAPHFSDLSVGRYHRTVEAAAKDKGLALDFVDSWHLQPPYIQGLADSVLASWAELGCAPDSRTPVIFSAHSLPKDSLPPKDPYQRQVRETAAAVAEKLALSEDQWTIAYLSASGREKDWLGPSALETIRELSARGLEQTVLCPCGFVADQVEILYDVDVVLKREAEDLGVSLARTALLNDSTPLIDSLARLVGEWQA